MKYTANSSVTASGAYGTTTGVTHNPDQEGPDSEGVVTVSGTYTSPTLVVEKQMPGSDVWAPVALFNESTFVKNSASASVTTDTTTSFRFSCGGAESIRAYFSAGTGVTAVIHVTTGTTKEFGGYASVLNSTATGSTTTFDSIIVRDSQTVALGTDSDLTMSWDGTDIDVLAAADNTMITVGASGNAFDLKWFGADANGFFTWDASANDLKFEDSVSVMFGTGAGAGVGNAGDVELRWDATDLDLLAAANNTIFKIGNGTNSFDLWVFGSTANAYISWDASADDLKFEDSVSLMFGTGAGAGPGNAGDVELRWDATDLDLLAAANNTIFKIGTGTNSFDVWLFGSSANAYISWDASADDLKFEDSVSLMFGTGAGAGPGNAGDVELRWDATDLDLLAAADDSVFNIGNGTNSFDFKVFGNAATEFILWDASADLLTLQGATAFVVGHSAQLTISDTDGATNLVPEVQVLGTAKADASVLIASFNTTDDFTVAPSLSFLKSGHATLGSNTIVASGEVLGEVNFFGADGADFESCAVSIRGICDTTPGAGDMPGRLSVFTSTDGAETPTERARITGTATASTLALGIAGATTGKISFAGTTSGVVTIQALAAAGTYTLSLPPDDGDAGEQLQSDGSGVMTWEAAGSLSEFKEFVGTPDRQEALGRVLSADVREFKYLPSEPGKKRITTGDYRTTYRGVVGDSYSQVMHHNGKIFSPVSAFGESVLAIQALHAKIEELERKLAAR